MRLLTVPAAASQHTASRFPSSIALAQFDCLAASIPAHTILLIEEEVFFFFGLIGLMLLVFANNVPATGMMVSLSRPCHACLRSVVCQMTVLDPVQRPLALGMQSVATRAVGSVPGEQSALVVTGCMYLMLARLLIAVAHGVHVVEGS